MGSHLIPAARSGIQGLLCAGEGTEIEFKMLTFNWALWPLLSSKMKPHSLEMARASAVCCTCWMGAGSGINLETFGGNLCFNSYSQIRIRIEKKKSLVGVYFRFLARMRLSLGSGLWKLI